MDQPEGHPTENTPVAQMETTIDPRTGAVTSRTVDGREPHTTLNQSPFSQETEAKYGALLGRFKDKDGTYRMDDLIKSLDEKQKMISAGEHKKPQQESPDAGPAKEEVSTGDPVVEPKSEAPPSNPIQTTKADPPTEAKADALTFEQLDALMAENGGLTQEQIDRFDGDWAVASEALTARAEKRQSGLAAKESLLHGIAGGEPQYRELMDWAGSNLTQEDCDRFNNAFNGNDTRLLELEMKDLINKRIQMTGQYGQHMSGASASGGGGDVFQSMQEYQSFVAANQYAMQNDRNFSQKAMEKFQRSVRAGKIR